MNVGRKSSHAAALGRSVTASDPPQQATTLRVAVDVDEGEGVLHQTRTSVVAVRVEETERGRDLYAYDVSSSWELPKQPQHLLH